MEEQLTNTLHVTETHLKVIRDALEIYDRLSGGQPHIAIQTLRESNKMSGLPSLHASDADACKRIDDAEYAWLRMYAPDDPRRETCSATWARRPPGLDKDYDNPALIAREVMQTIRRDLAYRAHPAGGWQTQFAEPMHHSKQPMPVLTGGIQMSKL